MRYWPDSFPDPIGPGFQLSPVDMKIRTDMEIGAARVRRRSRARMDRVQGRWRMTDAEFGAFRAWFEDAPWSMTGHSDDLTGATLVNATWTMGAAVGPSGQVAGVLLETTADGAHYAGRNLTSLGNDARVAVAVTLRASGRTRARVLIRGRDEVSRDLRINLTSGAVTSTSGLDSFSATARGAGWHRVRFVTTVGTGSATPALRVQTMTDAGVLSFVGDPELGVEVCELNARADALPAVLPTDANGGVRGAAAGSAWSVIPLALGGGYAPVEARFEQTFEATVLPGLNWDVTAPLEIRYA